MSSVAEWSNSACGVLGEEEHVLRGHLRVAGFEQFHAISADDERAFYQLDLSRVVTKRDKGQWIVYCDRFVGVASDRASALVNDRELSLRSIGALLQLVTSN